ncbi:PilZ domain-containing protein [Elusimicrobiota bacterium]
MKQERRKSPRIPLAAELAEPIDISFTLPDANKVKKTHTMPAILLNMSAGGMSLILFGGDEIFKHTKEISFVANIAGFAHAKFEGQVIYLKAKEGMQTIGIRFTSLDKKVKDRITKMIDDYLDCKTRVSLRVPDVCTGKQCHYHGLCEKPQKLELSKKN